MNEKTLHILEYDRIISILSDMAHSQPGKELCAALSPMDSIEKIRRAQSETADAVGRILRIGRPNFAGNRDMSFALNALTLGSTLSQAELLHIAEICECTERNRKYDEKDRKDDFSDTLTSCFEGLTPLPSLLKEIRRCLISEEEVADDATPELKDIRRKKILYNDRIHTELSQMVNSTYRTYLQDAVITMRNNRYCLPVKSEYKNTIHGMVHDRSRAGSTFFIEPAQIVEYNNKLQELESLEREEIERILELLSAQAAEYVGEIAADIKILSRLDFIFAKGNLALSMDGKMPEYVTDRILELRRARHPFIDKKKAVPIDLIMGETYRLLVITGPNTGGKTVSLKTTGLLCAMGQSGLHIPASSTSKVCVFREIYADIGDEQSIEQSLSTFSAHMTHIVSILETADKDCLCLFDELCAGTDPTEGAALAVAILRFLKDKNVMSMATTHYSELKVFALSEPDTENASCEFDVETLSPTYRLMIGIPGKSNAFAISSKLGLPVEIIDSAKGEISESKESFEDLLTRLERSRKELEEKESSIARDLEESARMRQQLEDRNKELADKKEKILQDARKEAREILEDAKETADAAIRAYHKGGDIRSMEKTRTSLRKKIDQTSAAMKPKTERPVSAKPLTAGEIKKGDYLEIVSMKMKGYVHSLPDAKGNLVLSCGNLQVRTRLSDVVRAKEENRMQDAVSGKGRGRNPGKYSGTYSKASHISPEINLLGQTSDEAVANLDKYLDDAYLSHLHSVRVVHGKGTGVLRDAVAGHLRTLSYVKSFHLGEYGEGDAGVTIVEFQ